MKCPVCKSLRHYRWPPELMSPGEEELIKAGLLDPRALDVWEEMPLYQYRYPGDSDHVSPRCLRCYDKADKKRQRRQERKNRQMTTPVTLQSRSGEDGP